MYVRFGGFALLLAIVLGSHAAFADDEFARKGAYAGAGGVWAIEEFGDGADDPYAGGFNLTLGYRVSQVLSVETEFEWVGHWYRDEDTAEEIRLSMWSWSANLKGNVPIGRISPYGVIGFGFYRVASERPPFALTGSTDDIDAMMKAGAGIDIYITKNVVFSPEWAYDFLFNGTESYD